jgi:hypothetical protein
MKKATRATSARTPARQLADFLAKYEPQIGRLVRAARAKLRKRMPGAIELVYDNYNALVIGFGPSERASEAVVSLAVYPRWVNLYFLRGATLPDPERLLRGSGRQGRYTVLESADEIDRPGIRALLEAALMTSTGPQQATRRAYTVIKSVSAKQRPRRLGTMEEPHNRRLQPTPPAVATRRG